LQAAPRAKSAAAPHASQPAPAARAIQLWGLAAPRHSPAHLTAGPAVSHWSGLVLCSNLACACLLWLSWPRGCHSLKVLFPCSQAAPPLARSSAAASASTPQPSAARPAQLLACSALRRSHARRMVAHAVSSPATASWQSHHAQLLSNPPAHAVQCHRRMPHSCPLLLSGPAACPSGQVKCGSQCIDPTTQCCKTSSRIGLQCTPPFTCPADGSTCSEWPGASDLICLPTVPACSCLAVSAAPAAAGFHFTLKGGSSCPRCLQAAPQDLSNVPARASVRTSAVQQTAAWA